MTINTDEVMKMMTAAMQKQGKSADEIAKMEICIQYLGNAEFRQKLNDYVFKATYKPNGKEVSE